MDLFDNQVGCHTSHALFQAKALQKCFFLLYNNACMKKRMNRLCNILLVLVIVLQLLASCRSKNSGEITMNDNWNHAVLAETANIGITNRVRDDLLEGRTFIGHFNNSYDFAEFTVTAPEDGRFDLFISAYTPFGAKYIRVSVNNQTQGEFEIRESQTPFEINISVFLNKGNNTINISPGWTWFYIEYVRIDYPGENLLETAMQFDRTLVNPNANEDARRLWNFLAANYGTKVISGQQAESINSPEIMYIKNVTGKTPAILGLDFMDYSLSRVERVARGSSVEAAIEWANMGGIVTFAWHWNAPAKYLIDQIGTSGFPRNQIWWRGFYTEAVNDPLFLARIMNGEDPQGYQLLLDDLDNVAGLLKRLQDAAVPVLWRPLHESSGGWFWWGSSGAQAQIWLWRLMYDRYTNYHGLNNLIWVWNGQHEDWFPGADYVDIAGFDIYSQEYDYGSQQGVFYKIVRELKDAGTMKIITLSENGPIPDIDNMAREKAMWSWWCVWNGVDNFVKQTSDEQLYKMYNDDRVITLEDLSNWL